MEPICPTSNQTAREERLNLLTHALALVFSLLLLPGLLRAAHQSGWLALGCALVFGLSQVFLFAISSLYHSRPHSPFKVLARRLDHCAIYLLIAGSYTPFMLLGLGGLKGWGLLLGIWLVAVFGIRYKLTSAQPYGVHSVLSYLLLGWAVLLVRDPLLLALSSEAKLGLFAGGVFYTAGVPFYAWQSLRHSHAIWHLFVMAGVACHHWAVRFHLF